MPKKKVERFTKLRVCASCMWIFKAEAKDPTCPKCGFGLYSGKHVFGRKVYHLSTTQEPWKTLKMDDYEFKLEAEIARG